MYANFTVTDEITPSLAFDEVKNLPHNSCAHRLVVDTEKALGHQVTS